MKIDFNTRRVLRIALGRPEFRMQVAQYAADLGRFRAPTVSPDPMYSLYVARKASLSGSTASLVRYGEIRQRVVSPVVLP